MCLITNHMYLLFNSKILKKGLLRLGLYKNILCEPEPAKQFQLCYPARIETHFSDVMSSWLIAQTRGLMEGTRASDTHCHTFGHYGHQTLSPAHLLWISPHHTQTGNTIRDNNFVSRCLNMVLCALSRSLTGITKTMTF